MFDIQGRSKLYVDIESWILASWVRPPGEDKGDSFLTASVLRKGLKTHAFI